MPIGQARMLSATLATGFLILLIKFLAAKKLIGMAIRVPKVVASRARNTVSTIFSQVASATDEICGRPTLVRAIKRIVCASATGCRLGSSTLAETAARIYLKTTNGEHRAAWRDKIDR